MKALALALAITAGGALPASAATCKKADMTAIGNQFTIIGAALSDMSDAAKAQDIDGMAIACRKARTAGLAAVPAAKRNPMPKTLVLLSQVAKLDCRYGVEDLTSPTRSQRATARLSADAEIINTFTMIAPAVLREVKACKL